jgi:hypothetical protein
MTVTRLVRRPPTVTVSDGCRSRLRSQLQCQRPGRGPRPGPRPPPAGQEGLGRLPVPSVTQSRVTIRDAGRRGPRLAPTPRAAGRRRPHDADCLTAAGSWPAGPGRPGHGHRDRVTRTRITSESCVRLSPSPPESGRPSRALSPSLSESVNLKRRLSESLAATRRSHWQARAHWQSEEAQARLST